MLLLDEPMAGMNVEEKQDMCRFILDVNDEFGTTIVLIEHDMGVVMDISDRVVVLDYGKKIGDGARTRCAATRRSSTPIWGLRVDAPAQSESCGRRRPHAEASPMSALRATATASLLSVNNIEVIYDHVILVLKGVSLEVPEGGIVALLGANGAGKSTTLKAISNLLRPSAAT